MDDLRGQLVALACIRHGLPPFQGRGVDPLPPAELEALASAVPAGADLASLTRAFAAGLDLLQRALEDVDDGSTGRLRPALDALRASVAVG